MNGPEHYAEAARLAELVMSPAGLALAQDGYDVAGAAQVHATLATIPPEHLAVYEWTQQRLLERLTEDHCLQAFRKGWHEADDEGASGDRVRRGIAAAIKVALL